MKLEISNEGDPECRHGFIAYGNDEDGGQSWKCDNLECKRYERLPYSGEGSQTIMELPPGAYIRNPGSEFYTLKVSRKGFTISSLSQDERKKRVLSDRVS